MLATSVAQAEMAGADLRRLREGKKTLTGMNASQLEHFASTPRAGLPKRHNARRRKIAAIRSGSA